MPNSNIFFGGTKSTNVKFGTNDVTLYYGTVKMYPTSVPIDDAVVTCDSAIYNGANQTAQNIVVVFSGKTLVENVDYVVSSNSGGTNVGTYDVEVSGTGFDYESTAHGTFTINKVTPTVTAPTIKSGLIYNTSAQALINAGSTNYGTLKYSLDNVNYSTSIPSGTNATEYTIYYKVDGNSNVNSLPASSITNSISAKVVSSPKITLETTAYTYDGTAKQPRVLSVEDESDTIPSSEYTVSYGSNIDAGTASVTITDYTGGNYTVNGSTTFIINKANGSVATAPTAVTGLVYNTLSQELIRAGASGTGVMMYKLDSGSWNTIIPTATNAGSYTVYYKASASTNYNESASGSVSCSIAKVTPTVTAPTPKTLTYNTSAQVLANAGSTNYGTMQYALDTGTYSTTVPSATNANVTYKVYYKVVGNGNINDVAASYIGCMIAEKRVTTPTITLSQTSYTYSGSKCSPTPTVKDGTTVIPSSEYTVTYSNNVNAGTATVTISDNTAGNYYISGTTTFTINKANGSVTTAPTAKSLTYNGSGQQLINAGSGTGTMLYYGGSNTSWSTSIPQGTNATSYTVYYKASASANYNESASGSVSCTINKANQSAPTATGASVTYGNTATATASGGGGQGSLEWSNGNTLTGNAGSSKSTTARWGGNSNYNASPYSNSVTLEITKATGIVTTPPTPITGLTDNGSPQALVNTGNGTGTMLYYNEVYYEVEYLQSTGVQYIDTRIIPDASTGIYVKAYVNTNDVFCVGSRNNSSNTRWAIGSNTNGWYWCYGNYARGYDGNYSSYIGSGNTIAECKMNYLNDKKWSASGSTGANVTKTLPSLSFTPAYNIRLFGSAGVDASYSKYAGKIYFVKITQGSNVVMDLIPVCKNGVGCMYDKISGNYYYNNGSGSFTCGPKKPNTSHYVWSTDIPSGTDATNYTVCYKTSASTNYNESPSGSVICSIGHSYVEIGGIKWATMNVGANSITDTGLYFQWGDTQGYTATQVGSGSGRKYFGWADYKYGNGTSSPGSADITKYNSTDGKTVLDLSDDAARANWGGAWRMPTTAEFQALRTATTSAWTADYEDSGVAGLVLTSNADSSKKLFFPACGGAYYGSVYYVGKYGRYWSSSLLSSNVQNAYYLYFGNGGVYWDDSNFRYDGFSVRGVIV